MTAPFRWRRAHGALLLLLLLAATPQAAHPAPPPSAPLRVLFVGNSYLYSNDLPRLVAALARSQGAAVDAQMRAEPDFALRDHLRDRRLRRALQQPWDWIVLQQGPSSRAASRASLIDSARRFRRRVDAAARARQTPPRRTRIALMAAWPPRPYADSSPEAEVSYRMAAEAIDACVLPVAAAWRLAREAGGAPELYQSDELHPTRAGSLLAAMAIVPGLVGLAAPLQVAAPADADNAERRRLAALENAARFAHDAEPRACDPRE